MIFSSWDWSSCAHLCIYHWASDWPDLGHLIMTRTGLGSIPPKSHGLAVCRHYFQADNHFSFFHLSDSHFPSLHLCTLSHPPCPQASAHPRVAPNYQGHSCGLSRDVRPWFAVLAVSLKQSPSPTLSLCFPSVLLGQSLTVMLTHSGCGQDQWKDSGWHSVPVGAWLVWPRPWMDLLWAPTRRTWLLGHVTLQVSMQNPFHLSLHQPSSLPIVVMKKLELREGKAFSQGSTANHHLQCTCIYELPRLSRPLWDILAPTTKVLE